MRFFHIMGWVNMGEGTNDITNYISLIERNLMTVFCVVHGVFYWYPPAGQFLSDELSPRDLV